MHIKKLTIFLFAVTLLTTSNTDAQMLINEASSRNYTQVYDEDGEYKDWIELYNSSSVLEDLGGYSLTDDPEIIDKWKLPGISLDPNSHLLIFASGKDKNAYIEENNWESPVLPSDDFHWIVPGAGTPTNWNTVDYDASGWASGQAGFGYGDGDDNTEVPQTTAAIYLRKIFTVPNKSAILNAICNIDYDDGFVAYINGIEICRGNISGTPTWDSYSSALREATMYSGGSPEAFLIDMGLLSMALHEGEENVFAVEVHNISSTSSDLSLIPYLSFAVEEGYSFYPAAPSWITNSQNERLHTNFKLDSKGESVYLYDASGLLADSLLVFRTDLNYSVGRETDGSNKVAIFMEATPGASNNSSTPYLNGYEPIPLFSQLAGFYDGNIDVSIETISTTATIKYTTNGDEPTTSSSIFTGTPLHITKSTVLRAKCFSTINKLPGITASTSYFINEEYSLPVLSVITDNSNLYGGSGIFSNTYELWNKPCYVEYFDTLKNLAFRQETGIQVDGGAGGSRTQPQTSFRIEPGHSVFGAGNLNYKLIPDRPERYDYSSFYVRNGSNQYLILPYKDGAEVKAMGENTFTYYVAYRPIAVHINGGFYGIYELREKMNDNYLEANYGMDIDSLDMIGVSYFKGWTLQAIRGSVDGFYTDMDYFLGLNTSSSTYLKDVDKVLDLDNYTDYIIGEMWIGNNDWPGNNIKTWRCKSTNYRWQFGLLDLEWALRPHEWTTSSFDAIQYVKNIGMSQIYSGIWYRMMDNEAYKYKFINRFADLMNTNYSFSVLGKMEQEIYDEVVVEMPLEYERWGTSDIDGQMNAYEANHNTFRSELSKRSAYVKTDLREHYDLERVSSVLLDVNPPEAGRIKISTIIPELYPWSGFYFSDVPIKVEAIAYPGYKFSEWDVNTYINDISVRDFTFEILNSQPNFVANFEAGDNEFTGVTITEINYKNGEYLNTTDWFELQNSTSSELNLDGWYFTDNDTAHKYFFEPISIPAEERLVVVESKMIFQLLYPEVTNFTGGFLFGLDSYADEINLYNSADQLVVSVSYSNAYPWPLSNNTEGRSIELIDPQKDLDDPYNWVAGCPMGTPGGAFKKCAMGGRTAIEEEISIVNDLHSLRAYPNPANELVNLEFYLSYPVEQANIKVYSIQGMLIKSEPTGALSTGTQVIPLNLSDISTNQMLFVLVTGPGFRETVKIIKE